MAVEKRFGFGDRVLHRRRPEWGIGSVVRAENQAVNGIVAQRLSIRFPGVGIKMLSTAHAELQPAPAPAPVAAGGDEATPFEEWNQVSQSEWLAPVAQRKIEEAMIGLPPSTKDPFSPLGARLKATLAIYRFDRSGRGLIDWAVAQTSLDDPLSRFGRHELEQFFDRWSSERELHLVRLLSEVGEARDVLNVALESAPAAGASAVRRLRGGR